MSFSSLIPWSRKKALPVRRQTEMNGDPFSMLQHEMNRMLDVFHKDFFPWQNDLDGQWMPQVNVAETAKEFTVTAELPGVDEKDVDVSFSENVLTIKGEKKAEHEEKAQNYHRVERSYGSFVRSIAMPSSIDADAVEATYSKGVLTVKLPKTAEAQKDVKKIAVKGD